MIKINKNDLNGEQIRISPGYISNGHWAIKLDAIENAALLRTEELLNAFASNIRGIHIMDDVKVEGCFPKERNVRIRNSGKILNSSFDLDPKRDRVVFSNDDGETMFDRGYVKLLGIAEVELFGDSFDGPFADEESDFVLMPVRG